MTRSGGVSNRARDDWLRQTSVAAIAQETKRLVWENLYPLSSLIVSVSEFAKWVLFRDTATGRVYRNQDRSVPAVSHPASFGEGRLLTCATHYEKFIR